MVNYKEIMNYRYAIDNLHYYLKFWNGDNYINKERVKIDFPCYEQIQTIVNFHFIYSKKVNFDLYKKCFNYLQKIKNGFIYNDILEIPLTYIIDINNLRYDTILKNN
jgi:hypothetical protein